MQGHDDLNLRQSDPFMRPKTQSKKLDSVPSTIFIPAEEREREKSLKKCLIHSSTERFSRIRKRKTENSGLAPLRDYFSPTPQKQVRAPSFNSSFLSFDSLFWGCPSVPRVLGRNFRHRLAERWISNLNWVLIGRSGPVYNTTRTRKKGW